MTGYNETQQITHEQELVQQILAAEQELTQSRNTRHNTPDPEDQAALAEAQQTQQEAAAKAERLETAHATAKKARKELETRLDNGDENVTAEDLNKARLEIDRTERLLNSAQKELRKADRNLKAASSDLHLARLAATVIETVTDTPVIIRNNEQHAPSIEPAIILTQTEPTQDYGTLEANGTVNVKHVGEDVATDWDSVREVFRAAGCEGSITGKTIIFERASWPLPRLSEPSSAAVFRILRKAEQAWEYPGSTLPDNTLARTLGVQTRTDKSKGLIKEGAIEFNYSNGIAVASTTLTVAAQDSRGRTADLENLKDELEQLSKELSSLNGTITPAGKVTKVTTSEPEKVHYNWGPNEVVYKLGEPVYPHTTAEVTLTVEFAYEEA